MDANATDIALAELRMLQDVIARQDDLLMRIRNWVVTLEAGLAVAFLADDIRITRASYLVVALGALVMFQLLDSVYGVAEGRAIDRSSEVEAALRSDAPYDGPRLACSMRSERTLGGRRRLRGAASRSVRGRSLATYLVVAVFVAIVAVVGSGASTTHDTSPPSTPPTQP